MESLINLKFYFSIKSTIQDIKSKQEYEVFINKDDRFWDRLVPYIRNSKVNGETYLRIDSMVVPLALYELLQKNHFSWKMEILPYQGTESNKKCYQEPFILEIPRVTFRFLDCTKPEFQRPNNMKVELFDVVIPYMTKLNTIEINEE